MSPDHASTPRPHPARLAGGCAQPVLLRGRPDHVDGSTGELLHRYSTVHEPAASCRSRARPAVPRGACPARRSTAPTPTSSSARAWQAARACPRPSPRTHARSSPSPPLRSAWCTPAGSARAASWPAARAARTTPASTTRSCHAANGTPATIRLGEPLCPDCYDYAGSVLFNACAPELWRRFTIALRRALARQAAMTGKDFAAQVRVSYAKVAEYQRRGVVHFHAIIRLDGPTGPVTPPPAWASTELPTAAITRAANAVRLGTPAAHKLPARTLRWGREHDIRPITTTGELTDTKVAAYVAKYASKGAECTGTLDRRITPSDRLADLPVSAHARRLIGECLRLGQLPELASLRLSGWAHMLGFRGHFSTKSRCYSTTLGALRAARAAHQRELARQSGAMPEVSGETILVVAHWSFYGRGHPTLSPGEHAARRAP